MKHHQVIINYNFHQFDGNLEKFRTLSRLFIRYCCFRAKYECGIWRWTPFCIKKNIRLSAYALWVRSLQILWSWNFVWWSHALMSREMRQEQKPIEARILIFFSPVWNWKRLILHTCRLKVFSLKTFLVVRKCCDSKEMDRRRNPSKSYVIRGWYCIGRQKNCYLWIW